MTTGKNFWTGKEITPQQMDIVNNASEKMVLYKIMNKHIELGENSWRYNWTPGFIDHINIMGEQLSNDPKLIEIYGGDNPDETNLFITIHIISRYLSANRIAERRLAGLPEWEKRSTSQEYSSDEINEEIKKLTNDSQGFNEIYDIAGMVYSMLRYDAVTSEGKFFKLKEKGVQ
jgi:hypothetical protein